MPPAPAAAKLLVVTCDRLPAWILPAWGSTWAATAAAEVRCLEAVGRIDPAAEASGTHAARLLGAVGEALAADRLPVVWCHMAGLGVAWDAPAEFREAYADPEDPPPHAGAAVPDLAVDADTDPDVVVGMRQAFAGQLTHLDGLLGGLFQAAAGRHVLLAGIRGIGLGLHGRVGTGPLPPFGELVHVPAILADAGGRMAAQRYGGLVVPADLGATLLELVGRPAPAETDDPAAGRSLTGLLDDWSARPRDRVVVAGSRGTALVTPGWHLLHEPGRPDRLYHKPDDYFELCDVADRCPTIVEELGPLAAAAAAGDPRRGWLADLSPAARAGA